MNNKEELSIKRRMKRIESLVSFSKKTVLNFHIDDVNIPTENSQKNNYSPKKKTNKQSEINDTLLSFQRNVKLVMD